MNFLVILGIFAALLVLRFLKLNALIQVLAWWIGLFLLVKIGFTTPVPQSVVGIYMFIVTLGVLAFLSADNERLRAVKEPLVAFLVEKRYLPFLALVVLAIPAAVAASIYLDMTAPATAPGFGRTVHPAPPAEITVHDTTWNLITANNPLRPLETSDPAAFATHLASGREVYYENCFYCHGDLMAGDGLFAHGLVPIPTNFGDGTIAGLSESYLFWRIAKGAPGLPEEAGPWESAMPAWEGFLTEEEMWEVVLFLYDFTGQRPRAIEEGHG